MIIPQPAFLGCASRWCWPASSPWCARPWTRSYDGSAIDGPAYLDIVSLAHRAPGWLDSLITDWSSYGLAVFAVLVLFAWWQTRRAGPRQRSPHWPFHWPPSAPSASTPF
ncbi:hypothetical protein [Streptomyces sp. NPDC006289]|uniref:hypothetical protein n=1 Tax=Streptomyces sp. NPDC006289 TaxID=3156744 RepID=UPI0033AD063D